MWREQQCHDADIDDEMNDGTADLLCKRHGTAQIPALGVAVPWIVVLKYHLCMQRGVLSM